MLIPIVLGAVTIAAAVHEPRTSRPVTSTLTATAVSARQAPGIDGRNDDHNVVTGTGGGDDKFTMLSLAGKYTLGPGVSLEANLWTAKLESNGSGGLPTSDNKGTGGVVGVVLVF